MGWIVNKGLGTTGAPVARALLALLSALLILEGNAVAEGISGYVDLTYTKGKFMNEEAAGNAPTTRIDSFVQRYNLTLDKRFYPNLGVLLGGQFERSSATQDTAGQEIDTTTTKTRPFVLLSLRNPLYYAEAGYNRNEEETKTNVARTTDLVQQNYYTTLLWKPDRFPSAELRYFHTDTYDKDRLFQNTTDDRYQFTSEYRPWSPLYLRYRGTFEDQDNKLQGVESRTQTHDGKISYADQWWQRRASMAFDYNVTAQETETIAAGAGEVSSPLVPIGGLSAISDTPANVGLAPNPALIDGIFGPGPGINLGLVLPGGDTRPRNLGLDFGIETEVNTILVWVDRDLPATIADSFSWDIYTSADNNAWVLQQTVFPAVFGPFVTRFEIQFQTVKARFVKAVTRPLSPAVILATDFPTLLVTELQASLRRSAADVQGKTSQTTHRLFLNARGKILDSPSLYYEFSYDFRKSGSLPSQYNLSNGLAFSHQFSRVFSGMARAAWETGQEGRGNRNAYVYTASITAGPLETLRHNLLYSGRREEIGGKRNDSDSFFLLNTATLYKGIDATLSLGKSIQRSDQKTDSTLINAGLTLVPHRTVTIIITYNDESRKTSGGNLTGELTDSTRATEGSVSFNPVQTIYLSASYRTEDRTGLERRTITNYAFTWSPFPDGTLQFVFSYNESLRSEENARDRNISPRVRWYITRASYLDLSYQKLTTDSVSRKAETEVTSANLRVQF